MGILRKMNIGYFYNGVKSIMDDLKGLSTIYLFEWRKKRLEE